MENQPPKEEHFEPTVPADTKPSFGQRVKGWLWQKPDQHQNAWKLITNLTPAQRLTFTAGMF